MNYIIATEYYHIINEIINDLAFKDTNLIRMDFNNNSIEEIIEEASYNSLFEPNKNIVVYNANIFSSTKSDDKSVEKLIKYLNNPNPNNFVFFIVSGKIDYRKKITKILKDSNRIYDYSKISYYDLVDLVNKYTKNNSWKINSDVINYVIKSSNNNYDIVCNELEKMMTCFPVSPSIEAAKKIISTSISDNVYKFIDYIVEKNITKANEILLNLKITKIDPAVILSLLVRQFKLMLFYKIGIKNNMDNKEIFKIDNLQDWQIKKIAEQTRSYSLKDLSHIICLLADYDYKYKSGRVDKDLIIELFVIDFMK